jgi:hypothetical protein
MYKSRSKFSPTKAQPNDSSSATSTNSSIQSEVIPMAELSNKGMQSFLFYLIERFAV